MSTIKPGLYKHFKGRYYQLLGRAHDSNNEPRQAVVYIPLYPRPGDPPFVVRDQDDFEKRFTYVDE